MTKAEAKKFRKRWQMVNAAEREELRKTPPEVKFRQLEALMASVDQLGWADALAAEEESVRARWRRLKSAYQSRESPDV
ncbi:hypothetical protein KJ068_09770 [bacterium]|nr:hypothetical protein [bacterium]